MHMIDRYEKREKRTTKEKYFWIFENIKGKDELKETQQKYFWNFRFFSQRRQTRTQREANIKDIQSFNKEAIK